MTRQHPGTLVDADTLFLRSGKIWSLAGMDLALAIIEEDFGRALAKKARQMVLYLRRAGRAVPFQQAHADSPVRSWKRLPPGKHGRWSRSIPWFSSTPCASGSATKASSATRPCISLGIRADLATATLSLWLEQNEGSKFWLRVMTELRNRGVEDILLAVVDRLNGFPDAIQPVFPKALVQTCAVHLLRNSLDFVSYKDRKPFAAALKMIYRALGAEADEAERIPYLGVRKSGDVG